MEARAMRSTVPLGILALLAACGPSAEDVAEMRSQQRQILAKLNDLEKKLDTQVAARPAAPRRPDVDPNKVFDIQAGNSPVKGPKDAPVVIAEFSDFQ